MESCCSTCFFSHWVFPVPRGPNRKRLSVEDNGRLNSRLNIILPCKLMVMTSFYMIIDGLTINLQDGAYIYTEILSVQLALRFNCYAVHRIIIGAMKCPAIVPI